MSVSKNPGGKEFYEFGPFRVDPEKETVLRAGEPVPLTPKNFQILLVLVRHSREVVTKDDLMSAVWPDTFVEEANLSRNIFMLRKALGETPQDRYIVTVPGRGYRLAESVQLVPEHEVSVIAATHSKVQVQVEHIGTRVLISVAAIVVLAVAAGTFRYLWHTPSVLSEKDTVVLADFANSTGDPVFDGTLRQAMSVQFEQSPFLSLVPDERLQQVLGMMGRPAKAPLTPEVAREVCERTASAAVLDGSITRLGSQYVLGLRATACSTGKILAEEQTQAGRKEDVLNALGQTAGKLRTRLGESLATVEKYNTPLVEATTSSLEALKAYSAGSDALYATGAAAAVPFFKRATEIDPKFGLAYAYLGRLYGDLGESDLSAQNMSKAFLLRDRVSEWEKLFITASYDLEVTGNLEQAQQVCETWAQAYPRDLHPHGFMGGMVYPVFGKYERALAESKRVVETDPNFPIGYNIVALDNLALGHIGEAEDTLQRASARKLEIPEFLVARYQIAFVKGDWAAMDREGARGLQESGGEDLVSGLEAFTLAYSGHLQQSRAKSQHAVEVALQSAQRERAAVFETTVALREAFLENTFEAKQNAKAALDLSKDREVEYGAAVALALVGDISQSQTLANDLEKRFPEDTAVRFNYEPTLRALVAIKQGEPFKAIELLQVATPYELGSPPSAFLGFYGSLYPVYVRGEAYLAARQGSEAAAEFQKIIDHPGIVISDPIGALAHLQVGRAYALAGEKTKAKIAYQDFLALWKNADAGIPILKEAQAEHMRLQEQETR